MIRFYQLLVPTRDRERFSLVNLLAAAIFLALAGDATAAQVTLANLTHTYNGSPKSATVLTVPGGLDFSVTYAGSAIPPTNVGNYPVVVTIMDSVETGTATGTLVIGKAGQTITLGAFEEKIYGDKPFIATAIMSSGLPITKWESTDPSVADISPSGLVTLVGAGQTSIIASSSGDTNHTAAWSARPLNVVRSAAPLPSGTQSVTYSGSAQGLDPLTLPSGLASEITYREVSNAEPEATPQVVFQNGPDNLALSYVSTGFQAVGYWGMAKYVSLGGTARKLDSCDVTMVSWARYDTHPTYGFLAWANANPDLVVPPNPGISVPGNSGGYHHPVTLSFYDYENDGQGESYRLLISKTVNAFIPWRPSTLADGVTDYSTYGNGYAFRVPFSFPDGVVLPQDVWVAVSFNTSTYGTAPVGSTGPYDALNIPRPSGQPLVGSTLLAASLLYKNWRWQSASGTTGPMLRLRAIPTNASSAPPMNAGIYEVKTKAAAFDVDDRSVSHFVINKAPLEVSLANLTQIRDGNQKSVTVSTIPGGITTAVTYAGSSDAPSTLGSYPVFAISADPNYEGHATGSFQIGDSFLSWQTATFATSGLPSEDTTADADPDGDGLNNFLEYAFNLNPTAGAETVPVEFGLAAPTHLTFTYRRNLHALDLDYTLQDSADMADPLSWRLVTPLSETTVSDDGSTRVIRATVVKPGQPHYFMRLKTSH